MTNNPAANNEAPRIRGPEQIERAFSQIAQAVEQFADAHSLRLDKCARGNAGWELTRPHDRGGTVYLLLLYEQTLGLGVGSVWQFPCPEMAFLYSHFRPVRACELLPDTVMAALESELHALAQVQFGYWTNLQPLHAAASAADGH